MTTLSNNRRQFFKTAVAGAIAAPRAKRTVDVALVQFDAVPEEIDRNLARMEELVGNAVEQGARWVMFHEGTVCDYTPRLNELAEPVPGGRCCARMIQLARRRNCWISFGLAERDRDRFYITQVFCGPKGFVYSYRKTWIWRDPSDKGYRDEWARYDPGTGPEIFEMDGLKATCFICADGNAARCIQRAAAVNPEIVFYPNNRSNLPAFEKFGEYARTIRAPMLVTNRTGMSWMHPCKGGCVVYSAAGEVLAKANREGREETLLYRLEV